MFNEMKKPFVIAGPCAAESRGQVIASAKEGLKLGVNSLRASLWKPRTCPGWEGIGNLGIPWLAEAALLGITVATEVMLPEQAETLMEGVFSAQPNARLIVWLGSRNQNHLIQRGIAESIKGDSRVSLMIKNPPWQNERQWLGIHDHVLSSGIAEEKVFHCHRGFDPSGKDNPHNFRNLPDFEMAMAVKEKTGRPMLLDPSHIGGNKKNVFRIIREFLQFDFDGLMIEVHPNPATAKTDANQQLGFDQLASILKTIRR